MPNLTPNNAHLSSPNSPDISPQDALLIAFLDDKEAERDRVIMKLRQLDRLLIRFGRRQQETLPRRVR